MLVITLFFYFDLIIYQVVKFLEESDQVASIFPFPYETTWSLEPVFLPHKKIQILIIRVFFYN